MSASADCWGRAGDPDACRSARRGAAIEVTMVVPARRALTAWWRNRFPRAPEWMPTLGRGCGGSRSGARRRCPTGTRWSPPPGNRRSRWRRRRRAAAASSTSSSTTRASTTATRRGWTRPTACRSRKIVISTWLADIMAERFASAGGGGRHAGGRRHSFARCRSTTTGASACSCSSTSIPGKAWPTGSRPSAGCGRAIPSLSLVGFGVKPPPRKLAVRRVPREPAAGAPGLALQPLPDLSLPVVGRGPRHAAPWRRWPAARRSAPTTTGAVATTPSTAAPRWCRRAATWTRWPGGSPVWWRTRSFGSGSRGRVRTSWGLSSIGNALPRGWSLLLAAR